MPPHKERSTEFLMPEKNIVKVHAELYYDLLLPPVKKTVLKDIPDSLKQPSIVAFGGTKL